MNRKLKAAGITVGLLTILCSFGLAVSKFPIVTLNLFLGFIAGLLLYGIYQGIYKNLNP